MVVLETRVSLEGVTGRRVTEFFIHCTDSDYQRWWQGTHLQFHTINRTAVIIGSLVYFDEYVGQHRLKCKGKITEYAAGKRIAYRIVKGLPLPAWLVMEVQDRPGGVDIVHTVKAGYQGMGRVLDPLIRLHLSTSFEKALNEHAHAEFSKLGDLLRQDNHPS
jgi:hypothetical protein